jgi:hypothetical protein
MLLEIQFKFVDIYFKLCKQETEVRQNHEYENIRNIGQSEEAQQYCCSYY